LPVIEKLPGSRMLDGQFTAVQQRSARRRRTPRRFSFLRDFVEESKQNA